MKNQKKNLSFVIFFVLTILLGNSVFAATTVDYIKEIEFSQQFENYVENNSSNTTIIPRMYDIPKTSFEITNPFKLTNMLGNDSKSYFTLKSIIPENMTIKDQMATNSCWTFSTLAALESNLALKNYKNNLTPIIYDFSERHMEYSTSRTFLGGVINPNGYNREVGDGGLRNMGITYLTNGSGAIAEADMRFQNNENKVYISEIQNKNVITQVNDSIEFPSYEVTENLTLIKQQMKNHIVNYGGIDAAIYGAGYDSTCYNKSTGAMYCNNASKYQINHAVTIVGWDDTYGVGNFVSTNRPSNPGAWIIKNSWGTEYGVDGFMYISYEDVNIYQSLNGIIDSQTEISYENIYQYDWYGGLIPIQIAIPKVYLATIFEKQSTSAEYLTQVSVYASEAYNCKVYVNPNGTGKSVNDLDFVELKEGESETVTAGYHTLEFAEPIKINSDNFVVVLEIEGTSASEISVMTEFNFGEFFSGSAYANAANHVYDNVTIAKSKCFLTTQDGFESNSWDDASNMYTLTSGGVPNFDTTIKAFTVSDIFESIKVTTPPKTTTYTAGQNFDSTGMVVTGYYSDGTSKEIENYTIIDGTDLKSTQTEVTITYAGLSTTQKITVQPNENIDEDDSMNSIFDDIIAELESVIAIFYSYAIERQSTSILVNINEFANYESNESVNYYYYISSNSNEKNITDWVKIKANQGDKLQFEINTLDISNYEEIANADKIYLYMKQESNTNGTTSQVISSAIELDIKNVNIEKYLDGEKVADVNPKTIMDSTPTEPMDNTVAQNTIPNAGKSAIFLIAAVVIFIIGRIIYFKYKNIQI